MNTPGSDHRKGCQCQTCVHPKLTVVYSCMSCGAGPFERSEDIQHNSWCRKFKADAAQGGVTTNPDGSIAYRHVPIVEEKQK